MCESYQSLNVASASSDTLTNIVMGMRELPPAPVTEQQLTALDELSRRSGAELHGLPDDATLGDVLDAEAEYNRQEKVRLLNMVPGFEVPNDAPLEAIAVLEVDHLLASLRLA